MAEAVLLNEYLIQNIFRQIPRVQDKFSASLINKRFHRVYTLRSTWKKFTSIGINQVPRRGFCLFLNGVPSSKHVFTPLLLKTAKYQFAHIKRINIVSPSKCVGRYVPLIRLLKILLASISTATELRIELAGSNRVIGILIRKLIQRNPRLTHVTINFPSTCLLEQCTIFAALANCKHLNSLGFAVQNISKQNQAPIFSRFVKSMALEKLSLGADLENAEPLLSFVSPTTLKQLTIDTVQKLNTHPLEHISANTNLEEITINCILIDIPAEHDRFYRKVLSEISDLPKLRSLTITNGRALASEIYIYKIAKILSSHFSASTIELNMHFIRHDLSVCLSGLRSLDPDFTHFYPIAGGFTLLFDQRACIVKQVM